MTQYFDADPVRLSQKQARAIMERLGAPQADYWTFGKALLWLLVVAVGALMVFVCFILWGVSRPSTRAALPADVSQIRLAYVGHMGSGHKRVVSNEILLFGDEAKAVAAIADRALVRKSWFQVKGIGACEMQLIFQNSTADTRRILSVAQEGDSLFLYDTKWRQPLQGMDPVRFLSVVPQSRLSAMRSEVCGS